MKLTINYKQRASKVLGLNIAEIDEYARRVKGHLNKCTLEHDQLTKNMIIQSVFIIQDIKDKKLKKEANELQITNRVIRKYQHEIKNMNHNSLGCTRISKELRLKYKVSVSASTIYRYLKNNGATNG